MQLNQPRRMQAPRVWFPGPPPRPGCADAKGPSRPGSRDTPKSSFSREPGSACAGDGRRARARALPSFSRQWLGLPLLSRQARVGIYPYRVLVPAALAILRRRLGFRSSLPSRPPLSLCRVPSSTLTKNSLFCSSQVARSGHPLPTRQDLHFPFRFEYFPSICNLFLLCTCRSAPPFRSGLLVAWILADSTAVAAVFTPPLPSPL
jgi:hypothetical protein